MRYLYNGLYARLLNITLLYFSISFSNFIFTMCNFKFIKSLLFLTLVIKVISRDIQNRRYDDFLKGQHDIIFTVKSEDFNQNPLIEFQVYIHFFFALSVFVFTCSYCVESLANKILSGKNKRLIKKKVYPCSGKQLHI